MLAEIQDYRLRRSPRVMGRPTSNSGDTPLAKWLDAAIAASELDLKVVAVKSGRSQSSISQIRSGERGASADMIKDLAKALYLGEDEEGFVRFLNAGLRSAGHAAEGQPTNYSDPLETITREIGYDWEDFTEEEKRTMRESLDSLVIGIVEKERRQRQKQSQQKRNQRK